MQAGGRLAENLLSFEDKETADQLTRVGQLEAVENAYEFSSSIHAEHFWRRYTTHQMSSMAELEVSIPAS